MKFKIKFINFC